MTRTTSRNHRIVYRLTDSEYRCLARAAALADMTPNDFARTLVLQSEDDGEQHYSLRSDPAVIQHLHHLGYGLMALRERKDLPGFIVPRLEALCQRIEDVIDEAISREKLE